MKRVNADSVLIILKWGGVLTHSGARQAEELGRVFRSTMYPGELESLGLLRLHSTYRHDLKIYSSDEGRVLMTAAAFAKGLLDLEGELTPILASLVRAFNTNSMLDDTLTARDIMDDMKRRLRVAVTRQVRHSCDTSRTYSPLGVASRLADGGGLHDGDVAELADVPTMAELVATLAPTGDAYAVRPLEVRGCRARVARSFTLSCTAVARSTEVS